MHFPLSFCKNAPPYFFHGAFAPSFIWSRRPCGYPSGRVSKKKRCVDKLSKSTYPSLAPITVFVISSLQSVTGILVHLVATLTGYVDILLNLIVFLESIVR